MSLIFKMRIIQMKKLLSLAIVFLLAGKGFAQSSEIIRQYILKYKDIAMEEMKRTGIPAAITLAQGIHETSAGQSVLVLKSNNHFGIKCKAEWTGPSVSHDDDARGECFRKYSSPDDSYRDHSDFLTSRSHYSSLFKLDPTDYEAWAYGLKKAGYATNPKYPQILIKLIRDYSLQDYTLIAMGNKPDNSNETWVRNKEKNDKRNTATVTPAVIIEQPKKIIYPSGIFKINETKVVFVPKGTSYLAVAQQYDVQLNRLFDFNDMRPQEVAMNDQLVYLQRKRKTGANEVHTVADGETLYDIAQTEGIRIESLLAYNFLNGNMQPQVGEKLYLHQKAPAMPRLATAAAIVTVVSKSNDFAKAPEEGNSEAKFVIHKVQTKETMYSIAKKYGVTAEDIVKWNDLTTKSLKIGQQLRIKRI
jgi:LysM repeat protein